MEENGWYGKVETGGGQDESLPFVPDKMLPLQKPGQPALSYHTTIICSRDTILS
jgi:hypothetical protein